MHRASTGALVAARQESDATPANLRTWRERTERVAALLQMNLGHGTKAVLGAAVGLRPWQLSRQLSGTERLTLGVVDAGVSLLEQEGKADVVAEIRSLISNGGRVARLDPVTFVYDPLKGTLEWGPRR